MKDGTCKECCGKGHFYIEGVIYYGECPVCKGTGCSNGKEQEGERSTKTTKKGKKT